MYAVVRTGGKQYRVEEGRTIKVERLPGEAGDTVELRDVLLMGEGADVTLGAPVIEGARVMGTIAEQGRASKVVVFRYKAKTRSRKKTGHRQAYTKLLVEDILAPGQEPKPKAVAEAPAEPVEEAPKPRRRRKTAATAVVEEAAAAEEATASDESAAAPEEAPAAAPARRRTRKKEE